MNNDVVGYRNDVADPDIRLELEKTYRSIFNLPDNCCIFDATSPQCFALSDPERITICFPGKIVTVNSLTLEDAWRLYDELWNVLKLIPAKPAD